MIKVYDADRGQVDLLLRYLKRCSVGGVGVRAEVFEWVGVGEVGREVKMLEGELKGGKGIEKEGKKGRDGKESGTAEPSVVQAAGEKVKDVVSEVKEKAEKLVEELTKKAE